MGRAPAGHRSRRKGARVRLVLATLLWLLTTIALAISLPAMWAQRNLVDTDGYAAFTRQAAGDPALQQAVAGELTAQIGNLDTRVTASMVGAVASQYTAGSSFPAQFAQANRYAHRWLFTNAIRSDVDPRGRWVIDLAPMLSDSSFQETLQQYGIHVPQTLPVPLTENAPPVLRPGRLRLLALWGPWVSIGLCVLTGVLALLTLACARRRGRGLAALGVSALLVGAAGWAGLEIGQRRLSTALADVSGDVRQISESMVSHAIAGLHDWLNIALLSGVGLVLLGVAVSALGKLRGSEQ
jgi:hypothetical protein